VATHPYAIAKGINWAAGAGRVTASGRVIGKNADCLTVPIRNLETNAVVAVQLINSDGAKQTFGAISGNGFICGNTLDRSLPHFVAEGWADIISLVFHISKGNAVGFAACGKGGMERLGARVEEFFGTEALLMEDRA
jgi:putative DNA primase/helicase